MFSFQAFAEHDTRSGIGEHVRLREGEDEYIQSGMIIADEVDGFARATVPYDSNMHGVVTFSPAVAIKHEPGPGTFPIVQTGIINVLVSTKNGAIEAGDFITSSPDPGVGMKATRAGFVLGKSLEPYTNEEGEIGTIPVSLNIRFIATSEKEPFTPRAFATQIQDAFTIGVRAFATHPNPAFRYLSAAIVLIISVIAGLMTFGKTATNGIVAIGRNPLARKSVYAITLFNIFMAVGIVLVGGVVAFFIITI